MKYLILALILVSAFPLFGQTKVWEATSPNDVENLSLSQDGSTIITSTQNVHTVWKTDSANSVKKIDLQLLSNLVVSSNNDTIYALGMKNKIGLYSIPINEDTSYFRQVSFLPFDLLGGIYLDGVTNYILLSTKDSTKLLFGCNYGVRGGATTRLKRGRIGLVDVNGIQTKDFGNSQFNRLSYNPESNVVISSGTSSIDPYMGIYKEYPYLTATSVNTGKHTYSTGTEYSVLCACRDSNYFVLKNVLIHIPDSEYVRTLTIEPGEVFHSCSFNNDYYITLKKDTVKFIRFDRDTASVKLYCGGTINACQLSSDGRRLVVLTNSKTISVYEIPFFVDRVPLYVDFKASYSSPYNGGDIQFTNNSYIPGTKYSLLWEFGDGDTSSLIHPKHIYNFPGNYTVSLTITTQSGEKHTTTKANYIIYDDIPKPQGALWVKKYSTAGITALTFAKDSIVAGTNDGAIFSMNLDGNLGRFVTKNFAMSYRFENEIETQSNILHFKNLAWNENTSDIYALGVPKGTSSYSFLYKYNTLNGLKGKIINIGTPGYKSQNVGGGAKYYESNDGGNCSLDINLQSTYLHYANYGKIGFSWTAGPPPNNYFSGGSDGNYVGTLLLENDSIAYDNGRYPTYYGGMAPNPSYLKGSENLSLTYVRSIRGGLPYNPNSYFVITMNNVYWIRYGTFDRINKFPTKGDVLRHSPDQYHSFTSDGVWSFADGKLIDSLPLLAARSFEVFPDGVHLLVMYPKSDTVAIFNTQTKTYEQYFKANFIISSIAIAKDGKSFATGDTGGIVTLWQTPKLSITKKIEFISPQSDKNHVKGDTVQFFNTSVPVHAACRNEWDFGDGTTSQERFPKHVYGKAGKYSVRLRAYCPPEIGVDSMVDILEKAAYITVTDTVTSADGREEVSFQEYLCISPNPLTNHGIISVNFPKPEHYSIMVTTLLGQEISVVRDVMSACAEYTIPTLPSGYYICQLRLWNGEIITKQFIVSE